MFLRNSVGPLFLNMWFAQMVLCKIIDNVNCANKYTKKAAQKGHLV